AYSPLDPTWPAARVRAITNRLGSVVVDPATLADLRSTGGDAPHRELTDEDLAVIVFTSGTTGEPKGVLVPHRTVIRQPSCSADIDFTSPPVMPLAAAVPWDAMAFELWGTILSGGTLVIIADRFLTPARLREVVATHGVDTVLLSTSLFNMHVEEDIDAFRGIRQVLTGGEQQSADNVFAFVARYPSTALVNLYGPTENGLFSTTHRFTAEDAAHGRVPIGKPPRGTTVFLVDGEIIVGGDGLTHGYLADPEGTARRFVRMTVDG
ncbi:AMP-binding protein, partial [Kibdelosporangium lantanae]